MSSPITNLGSIGSIGNLPELMPRKSESAEGGFSGVLSNVLQQVNQLNGGAEQQIGTLLKGGNADMSSVRSYQLNASAVAAAKQMIQQSIDILKS